MTLDTLLEADGLSTHYGTSQALFDVSLKVPRRGGVAILGRNGAGKTTLLQTLAGHLRPTRGSVMFDGQDATHMPTEQRVRRGLGHVPQEQGIFGGLTVKENMLLGAMAADRGGQRIDEIVQLFPRLAPRMSQRAGTLSGGERKMLAIGRALLGDPHVILLDEPTEGLWHEVIEEITQRLEQLTQKIAVVIVEQHVALALRVSEYCYVMDRGRIALEGPSDAVGRDPKLVRLLEP